MPGKGHALEKPTINDAHKAAVQAKLERDKKAAAEARGPFAKQLVAEVELAHLSDARKADAYVAIDEACYALDKGDNPFDLLRPPAKCGPCHGRHGGTHHMLCLKRKQKPEATDRGVDGSGVDFFTNAAQRKDCTTVFLCSWAYSKHPR